MTLCSFIILALMFLTCVKVVMMSIELVVVDSVLGTKQMLVLK